MAEAAYQRLVNDFGMDKGIEVLHQRLRSTGGTVAEEPK